MVIANSMVIGLGQGGILAGLVTNVDVIYGW